MIFKNKAFWACLIFIATSLLWTSCNTRRPQAVEADENLLCEKQNFEIADFNRFLQEDLETLKAKGLSYNQGDKADRPRRELLGILTSLKGEKEAEENSGKKTPYEKAQLMNDINTLDGAILYIKENKPNQTHLNSFNEVVALIEEHKELYLKVKKTREDYQKLYEQLELREIAKRFPPVCRVKLGSKTLFLSQALVHNPPLSILPHFTYAFPPESVVKTSYLYNKTWDLNTLNLSEEEETKALKYYDSLLKNKKTLSSEDARFITKNALEDLIGDHFSWGTGT